MEDDSMELDETTSDTKIIERNESGINIISNAPSEKSSKGSGTEKADEVVILDDDDDEDEGAGRGELTEASINLPERNVEIIDLVERSVNSKCINYACKDGKEMLIAPNLCLSYYRVKNAVMGMKEVCRSCYEQAMKEYDLLSAHIQRGEVLCQLDLPIRNDTVEIADSDEENEPNEAIPYLDEENFRFLDENFERVLAETMKKLNFEAHAKLEVDCLQERQKKTVADLKEISESINEIRTSLDHSQMSLYNEFRTETVKDPEINIIHDSTGINLITAKKTYHQRRSLRNVAAVSYVGLDSPNSPQVEDQSASVVYEIPPDAPQPGTLEPPEIEIDGIYFVSREKATGSWIKARLKEIIRPGVIHNHTISAEPRYRVLELKQQKERLVNGKNIASTKRPNVRLEIGTRVVAMFTELLPDHLKKKINPYYPGIVGEPAVESNKYRYMIFFDIGYSQYVDFQNVHVVFKASERVWEDMHETSRSFIKKYLEAEDRPMVKLSKGQVIRTEYNGKWVLCTIVAVDCSLVLVLFDSLNRFEWIYRGSTRLSPMFKEQNTNKRHAGGRTSNNRRQDPNESTTIVQYKKTTDFDKLPSVEAVPRAVARKSTARPEIVNKQPHPANCIPFLPPVTNASVVLMEPTSKIMYFTPRDQVITQRLFRPHGCTPACKDYVRHSLAKLRGHNPLSKPLLCGWARVTIRVKGRKEIMYKAPCSRMLRDIRDVHRYLRLTKSDMTVDLFDFNHNVRCLAEFSVECTPDPKDLSKGLEQVPVPVINGINSDTLDFSTYLIKRTPMEDVPLNTDPEFLCGCDCQDDCADKLKCACWRLTLEGAKYMGKNIDPNSIGYSYRRLHEQVLTGIYECNSRCKCASTCLNRVVQNPMSIKLQVFKTHNRGWGIRCVNDVPQGTFICIYAGTIHTEQMANEDGVTHGDEYFAELDYIENCEKHKEDYESEVIEPRSSRSRSDSPDDEEVSENQQRRKRSRANKDNDFVPFPGQFSGSDSDSNAMKLRRTRNMAVEEKETSKATDDIETVTISDDEDDPKEVLNFNPENDLDDNKSTHTSIRSFFGEEEPYIMDTKNAGNIGRFLNHSCSPNVFVQNVFVDTHDVRFPWVAFFCSQSIRAGTELTWNYNYDIGSVPGRVLYCHCGSPECKGRLL